MRGVLALTFANIRKRKAQSTLLGATLLLAALLLSTAIGLLQAIDDPVDRMFESQRASHATMMVHGGRYDADEVAAWWRSRPEVDEVAAFPYFFFQGEIAHDGSAQSMGDIMLAERPDAPPGLDQLRIVEGSPAEAPADGEIWLPTGFAFSRGLQVGQTLEFSLAGQSTTLTVGAIVVDPQFSASVMNPIRAWVPAGFLAGTRLAESELGTLVGVRMADESEFDSTWAAFEEHLDAPFTGYVFESDLVKGTYSMVHGILAYIMLAFGGFIVLIAVFVLGFAIASAVAADRHVIGVLKALGFTPRDIRGIYVSQYVLLALAAAPLGVFASRFAIAAIMDQMARSLGTGAIDVPIGTPAAVTMAAILATTMLAALLATARAGAGSPAEVIRGTDTAPKAARRHRTGRAMRSSLPVPVLLAVRGLFSGRSYAAFLGVSGIVLALVLTFSVNTFASVRSLATNFAYWGFDGGHVHITASGGSPSQSRQDVLEMLDSDPRVAAAVPYEAVTSAAIAAQSGEAATNVIGFAYGGDMDAAGLMNLRGASPRNAEEVAISHSVSQTYRKDVGDTIEIFVNGDGASYRVTGVYQTINAMGWGIRLREDALRAIDPTYEAANITVVLSDGGDATPFAADMAALLGEDFSVRSMIESGDVNLAGIADSIALVSLLLSAVFVGVAFIIVFNTIAMEIHSSRRSLGIYGAVGMTPVQVRLTLLWKALGLAGAGSVIGVILALLVSPPLLSTLIQSLGMARFPMDATMMGTLGVVPICLAVIAASAWLPSRRTSRISPRELVID